MISMGIRKENGRTRIRNENGRVEIRKEIGRTRIGNDGSMRI